MVFNREIELGRSRSKINFWSHAISKQSLITKKLEVCQYWCTDMFYFPLNKKSTRIWDTFAEPNNKTIPSEAFNQNQASFPPWRDPRPKSRLTEEGCGGRQLKTCLLGVQKHLSRFGGFFYSIGLFCTFISTRLF